MRLILAVFLLFAMATPVVAQTTVREFNDRVEVEITGTPPTEDFLKQQETQNEIGILESKIQQLMVERAKLERQEDEAGNVNPRARMSALSEISRQIKQIEDQLRDLGVNH